MTTWGHLGFALHGGASGSKFQLPDHVRLVLYKGKDEYSTYADPNCSEAYDKVISEECANELHSVQ